MRELVFALEFRGTAGPVAGSPTKRRATSAAPSQTLTTILGTDVRARVDVIAGERAMLESRVERFDDGSFVEDGTIRYGRAGGVSFVTVGRGTVAPSPIPGWTRGAVVWSVTGGDGLFAGARGLITSNFAVSLDGEVIDHHVARLYVRE